MPAQKKERVELQFNMESEAEKELLEFIDQNGTTRAGFIKSAVRQYMNAMQSLSQNVTSTTKQGRKNKSVPKNNKQKQTTKKVPKLGSSFSSKDFE